ncbi:fam-f protein [Plasmodium gallinaceum]|uniref:Fam-f protein n=1 Tax=Plasmodium gallinaceum TaxID=5849 RepID=A0A1J1GU54_PLAGA|nr:fam-f protein [Plasmodium gallinaceum]CRG95991.1 fam-f protein [Plasmodium gallinaceum]
MNVFCLAKVNIFRFTIILYPVLFWLLLWCRGCTCSYSIASSSLTESDQIKYSCEGDLIPNSEERNELDTNEQEALISEENDTTNFIEKGEEYNEGIINILSKTKNENCDDVEELKIDESKLIGNASRQLESKDPEKCEKPNFNNLLTSGFYTDISIGNNTTMKCLRSIYSYVTNTTMERANNFRIIYTKFANSFLKLPFKGEGGNLYDIIKNKNNSPYIIKGHNIELYIKMLKKKCANTKNIFHMEKDNIAKAENMMENFNLFIHNYLTDLSETTETITKVSEFYENFMLDDRKFNFSFFNDLLGINKLSKVIFFLSSISYGKLDDLKMDKEVLESLNSHMKTMDIIINNAKKEYNLTEKIFFRIFKMKKKFKMRKIMNFLRWYFINYENKYESRKDELLLLFENDREELEIKKNLMEALQNNQENLKMFKRKLCLEEIKKTKRFSFRKYKDENKTNFKNLRNWNNAAPLLEKLISINKVVEFLLVFQDILSKLYLNISRLQNTKSEDDERIIYENITTIFNLYHKQRSTLKFYTQWFLLIYKIKEKLKELDELYLENKFILDMIKHCVDECNYIAFNKNRLNEKECRQRSQIIYHSLSFILTRLINNNGIFIKYLA